MTTMTADEIAREDLLLEGADNVVERVAGIDWARDPDLYANVKLAILDLAREYAGTGIYDEDYGECDCGEAYSLASSDDHCPECGTCWDHCEVIDMHSNRDRGA
jgi:hypothetical protein